MINVHPIFEIENLPQDFCVGNKCTHVISINPDLIVDFGHFLNYEIRMHELFKKNNITYHAMVNKKCQINLDYLNPIFQEDSGYYCLYRNSSKGEERRIANNLLEICKMYVEKITNTPGSNKYIFFFYTGSSSIASELSKLQLPPNFNFVINCFWDFLENDTGQTLGRLTQVKLQKNVSVLAMSKLHSEEWQDKTGLVFPYIPNPPPLQSDSIALRCIKSSHFHRKIKLNKGRVNIFFPGLMTGGKGKEITREFFESKQINIEKFKYTLRDRRSELPKFGHGNIEVVTGDLEQSDLEDLFLDSDIAVLPYSTDTFKVRTSGAIVDCLMFGVVPIVYENTWLSAQCKEYGFGKIIKENSAQAIFDAINLVSDHIDEYRAGMYLAAARYLIDNNWCLLAKAILNQVDSNAMQPDSLELLLNPLSHPFAYANYLFRNKRFDEALPIYEALKKKNGLSIYDFWINKINQNEYQMKRSGVGNK